VETLDAALGTFHAVVFAGLPGIHLRMADLGSPRFIAWGAALGQLHAHVVAYAGLALATRLSWRNWLDVAREHVPAGQSAVRRELDAVAALLEGLPVDGRHHGLIHGDFELDTLRWPEPASGAPGILDFDDCSRHWFAADVAFALRDLFDHGADLTHPSVDGFVRGYRSRFPLDDESFAALTVFSRLSRLLVYARLVGALDLAESPDQPEWLHRLREKLGSRMSTYAGSLER
jgi:Ser/Thr protein kinase RdoA (MazF antagonist)